MLVRKLNRISYLGVRACWGETIQRWQTDTMNLLAVFRGEMSLYLGRIYEQIQPKVYKGVLPVLTHY